MAKKKSQTLTPMQKAFVREYVLEPNGKRAAIRAGYKENSAESQASRLLRNDKVKDAIAKGLKKAEERAELSKDMVIKELTKTGFASMADFITIGDDGVPVLDFTDVTPDKLAAVSSITQDVYIEGRGKQAKPVKKTTFRLHDKVKSLVQIAKLMGWNVIKHEVSGTVHHEHDVTDEMKAKLNEIYG